MKKCILKAIGFAIFATVVHVFGRREYLAKRHEEAKKNKN